MLLFNFVLKCDFFFILVSLLRIKYKTNFHFKIIVIAHCGIPVTCEREGSLHLVLCDSRSLQCRLRYGTGVILILWY